MKIEEFYKLENVIEKILEEDEGTRQDDMYLYHEYCKKIFKNGKHLLTAFHFRQLFWNKWYRKDMNIRTFESVRRVRQKIQNKRPELKDKETAEARIEESLNYEKYALN